MDDGLHQFQANATAFHQLWEIVIPGGAYVIEDVKQSELISLVIHLADHLRRFEWSVYTNYNRKSDNALLCIRKVTISNVT